MDKGYDSHTYEKVGQWFEEHREEMAEDIKRLVRIPSISDPQAETGPFGKACRDAMDEMLAMGRKYGFFSENKEYYVGTIGREKKDWDNTIGLWNHLDVVPLGEGWDYAPFDPVVRDGYLIGRGAQDNKGPAVAMLYVMRCIRDLKLDMKHEICLFVGCDEERGMADLEYYGSRYPFPALSMIADCGFPVCYGEKGILEGWAAADDSFSEDVIDLYGGSAGNIIPDRAVLVLRDRPELEELLRQLHEALQAEKEEGQIRITARGTSRHSAFPEGSVNAIHELAKAVCAASLLKEEDRRLLHFIEEATSDYYGERIGIAYEDEVSGRLTCAGTVLKLQEGKAALQFNIRYSITADPEHMEAVLDGFCSTSGYHWELIRNSAPNYFPKERKEVALLTSLFNELTGSDSKPYVMGGGTYARKLPNAFGYGIGSMPEREDDRASELFAKGHGGAHEPDEGLDLKKLLDAAKIYTMAMLTLNDCEISGNPQV